jgi:hypothetical protein
LLNLSAFFIRRAGLTARLKCIFPDPRCKGFIYELYIIALLTENTVCTIILVAGRIKKCRHVGFNSNLHGPIPGMPLDMRNGVCPEGRMFKSFREEAALHLP